MDHPQARVRRDHVQAETGEANRELAGPTCAVEDARVGLQGLKQITERRD